VFDDNLNHVLVVIRKLKTIKLDVPSSLQELQTIAQLLALGFRGKFLISEFAK
jgi:hypothetical protein